MKLITENSIFVIDFDEMTCTRTPRSPEAKPLRKDGEAVPFYGFVRQPKVGEEAQMLIKVTEKEEDIPGFERVTCRTTSIVQEIKEE